MSADEIQGYVERPRVNCPACGGHGLVDSLYSGGVECSDCDGRGTFVVYPNDGLALYSGGPMRGSWPGKYAELIS